MFTSLLLAASLLAPPPSVLPLEGFEERMVAFGMTVAISGDQAFVGEPRGGC